MTDRAKTIAGLPTVEAVNRAVVRCRACPRLVEWRERVAAEKRASFRSEEYWGKGVPGFGDPQARLLIVGLAPAAHGANRTGRVFTGDRSGDWLYAALHRAGFASQAESVARDDGLVLSDAFVTAAVRCAPPANKPDLSERAACRPFLERELELFTGAHVVVSLGGFSFSQVLRIWRARGGDVPRPATKFGHGAEVALGASSDGLPAVTLLASYHPSQQNTFTGTLTVPMFDSIWSRARDLIGAG